MPKLDSGQALYAEAKKYIPGGTQLLSKRPEMFLPEQWPSYYQSANGIKVVDLDGREYLDFSHMGAGTCPLGYSDEDVNRAVAGIHDHRCSNRPSGHPEESYYPLRLSRLARLVSLCKSSRRRSWRLRSSSSGSRSGRSPERAKRNRFHLPIQRY